MHINQSEDTSRLHPFATVFRPVTYITKLQQCGVDDNVPADSDTDSPINAFQRHFT